MVKLNTLGAICIAFHINMQAQYWTQEAKLIAQDRTELANFGSSVSISGSYAVVGSKDDDESTQPGLTLEKAGSAYVFKKNNQTGQWNEVQKLVASDRNELDLFGTAVSIHDDLIVIGARGVDYDTQGQNFQSEAGAAYIFQLDSTGNWMENTKIVSSDRTMGDYFGRSVSCHNEQIIIGALYADTDQNGGIYKLNSGAAYVFEIDSTGAWIESQKMVTADRDWEDYFGHAVAIKDNYILIGALGEDHINNSSIDLLNAGAVYAFEKDNSGFWVEQQKMIASDHAANNQYGNSIALDGNVAIIGSFSHKNSNIPQGATYILMKDSTGQWTEHQQIIPVDIAANDQFGWDVDIANDIIVVGSNHHGQNELGSNFISQSGAAYIYKKNETNIWEQFKKITPLDRADNDQFGNSVAIDGENIIVTANFEDHDLLGDYFLFNAGAAYIFNNTNDTGMGETGVYSIKYYPNPAKGIVTFQTENQNYTLFRLKNSLGQIITEKNIQQLHEFSIDLNNQASGLYFVSFQDMKGKILTLKLMVH